MVSDARRREPQRPQPPGHRVQVARQTRHRVGADLTYGCPPIGGSSASRCRPPRPRAARARPAPAAAGPSLNRSTGLAPPSRRPRSVASLRMSLGRRRGRAAVRGGRGRLLALRRVALARSRRRPASRTRIRRGRASCTVVLVAADGDPDDCPPPPEVGVLVAGALVGVAAAGGRALRGALGRRGPARRGRARTRWAGTRRCRGRRAFGGRRGHTWSPCRGPLPGEAHRPTPGDVQRARSRRGVDPRPRRAAGPEETPVGVGRRRVDAGVGLGLAADPADEARLGLHVGQREAVLRHQRVSGLSSPVGIAHRLHPAAELAEVDDDADPAPGRADRGRRRAGRERRAGQRRRGHEGRGDEPGQGCLTGVRRVTGRRGSASCPSGDP